MTFDDILVNLKIKEKKTYTVLDDIDVEYIGNIGTTININGSKQILQKPYVVLNDKLTSINRQDANKFGIRIDDQIGNLELLANDMCKNQNQLDPTIFMFKLKLSSFLKNIKEDDPRISSLTTLFNSNLTVADKIDQFAFYI